MRHSPYTARLPIRTAVVAGLVAALAAGLLPLGRAHAATAVPLGTADSFAILAGSTITNTGHSVVAGDIGLHPGTAVTGFGPGADAVTHNGSLHVTDGVALQAKTDLSSAYTDAAGQTPVTEVPTELGGRILTAGVYDSASGTFGITGPLTLDGEGDPDAVFIFQMGSALTTASASSVNLINDADVCNVFWQVGSSATLGSDSIFRGTIMADQSITLNDGATIEGRVLAREGAVTMDTNTITNTACTTPATDDGTSSEDDATSSEDDATSSEDVTASDEATSSGDATVSEGGTPTAEGTPTDLAVPQIGDVPSGPVAAGGGSDPAPVGTLALVVAALLVAAAAVVGIPAWRRGRGQGG